MSGFGPAHAPASARAGSVRRLLKACAGHALAAVVTLAGAWNASAAEPQWNLELSGLAGTPIDDGKRASSRFVVEPSMKLDSGAWTFRADARLRRLDLDGERTTRADLRDLTLGWRGSDATLTIGAQQINWGRMDLLRVTDAVNPVDQGDLFLEDLPEAKLAVWMANWEWQRDDRSVQLIVAPHATLDRFATSFGGLTVQARQPDTTARTATVAARYGFAASGWNTDLVAIHGWQTTPELALVSGADGALSWRTQPSRQDSVGLSADRPFGRWVLRVEGQAARTKPYEPMPGSPSSRRRSASLGIGADLTEGAWFFAAQAIAREAPDETPPHVAYVSAIVQRKWLQDRLALRGVHLRETDTGSSWTSIQARYELSPNQELRLQADRFAGEPGQPFGAYAGRSRIALSLRARF